MTRRTRQAETPRRWKIPPAITRGPVETVERLGVLGEHEETRALLLWRLIRDVELWARTPRECRAELFTSQADQNRRTWLVQSAFPPALSEGLAELVALLAPGNGDAPGADVGAACAAMAQWARASGAKETAVGFAQAAALASPDEPRYAFLTGECAEEMSQHTRASTWFQRAVTLGRRARDWSTYSLAFVALGAFAEEEGRIDAAHRAYIRAFRTTRRSALPSERARATYRLFCLSRRAGDTERATRYAQITSRAIVAGVGPGTAAALDLLGFWMEHRQGAPVRRLLAHLSKVEDLADGERFTVAVFRVRAAIAWREPITAKRALGDAWSLEAAAPGSRADALLQLAALAARLKDFDAVRKAGKAALVHAEAEEYERVRAELRRIGGPHVSFDPRASRGAA